MARADHVRFDDAPRLEIGLRNPRAKSEQTPPLDASWLHEADDDLASGETVARVMNEFGFGAEQAASTPEASWRERLMHLSSLIDRGLLGQWVQGATLHGWTVEAVRTELPFFHRERLQRSTSAGESVESEPHGPSVVEHVNMDFSGRADLVLALVDEHGQGALKVVDLKAQVVWELSTSKTLPKVTRSNRWVPRKPIPFHKAMMKRPSCTNTVCNSRCIRWLWRPLKLETCIRASPYPAAGAAVGANGRMVELSQGALNKPKRTCWRIWTGEPRSILTLITANPGASPPGRSPASNVRFIGAICAVALLKVNPWVSSVASTMSREDQGSRPTFLGTHLFRLDVDKTGRFQPGGPLGDAQERHVDVQRRPPVVADGFSV